MLSYGYPFLAPGDTYLVEYLWHVSDGWDWELSCYVDPNNEIRESNEANNSYHIPIEMDENIQIGPSFEFYAIAVLIMITACLVLAASFYWDSSK